MKIRVSLSVAALLIVTSAPPAFAWGSNGHRIVCEIAWQRMSAGTRQMIRELQANDPSSSFAFSCTWADEVRDQRPETKGYHFINIPAGQAGVDMARDCASTTVRCAPWAIEHYAGILMDASRGIGERNEALKFVAHFVGDLHQPLHAGRPGDLGGNQIAVTFFGSSTNLHSVWDTRILSRADIDLGNIAELDDGISDQEVQDWTRPSSDVDLVAWTNESYRQCEQFVYARLPSDRRIRSGYFDPALDITREQLQKAGVRLADLLDRAAAGTLRFS